jgi:hypothetical protein
LNFLARDVASAWLIRTFRRFREDTLLAELLPAASPLLNLLSHDSAKPAGAYGQHFD